MAGHFLINFQKQKNQTTDYLHYTLKITDFGFARIIQQQDMAETICGSPLYMAPEVMKGHVKYEFKADIWSFGIIFWELLYGTIPACFLKAKGIIQLLSIIESDALSFPAGNTVSSTTRNIITKILQKNPEERITYEAMVKHPYFHSSNGSSNGSSSSSASNNNSSDNASDNSHSNTSDNSRRNTSDNDKEKETTNNDSGKNNKNLVFAPVLYQSQESQTSSTLSSFLNFSMVKDNNDSDISTGSAFSTPSPISNYQTVTSPITITTTKPSSKQSLPPIISSFRSQSMSLRAGSINSCHFKTGSMPKIVIESDNTNFATFPQAVTDFLIAVKMYPKELFMPMPPDLSIQTLANYSDYDIAINALEMIKLIAQNKTNNKAIIDAVLLNHYGAECAYQIYKINVEKRLENKEPFPPELQEYHKLLEHFTLALSSTNTLSSINNIYTPPSVMLLIYGIKYAKDGIYDKMCSFVSDANINLHNAFIIFKFMELVYPITLQYEQNLGINAPNYLPYECSIRILQTLQYNIKRHISMLT